MIEYIVIYALEHISFSYLFDSTRNTIEHLLPGDFIEVKSNPQKFISQGLTFGVKATKAKLIASGQYLRAEGLQEKNTYVSE